MEDRSGLWRRIEPFVDSLIIFLATAALIRPLFKARYLAFWGSIESTFIADARFLIEHWPHPNWQPLWYTGTRWDYIYPPALRYGTAAVSMIFGYAPVKAYHVYTAVFYCLGIVGVYFMIRTGTISRSAAWIGAAAAALLSPSFLFLKDIRQDAWSLAPQRLGVLVKYGEGPHITAVALLPFALAFSWRALDRLKTRDLALASIFCAAVVAHNFYGATSLAMFYPLLVWSIYITNRDTRMLWRAAAIPVLAYGLTAVWLTPSYFRITTANMKLVSQPGNAWSMWVGASVVAAFGAATWVLARGCANRAWAVFVAGSALFFWLNVAGFALFHFQVYGDSLRLAPELDLALILASLVVLAWLWRRPGMMGRVAAAVLAAGAFLTSWGYVRHAWSMFPVAPNYQDRIEYRVSEWLWKNMPQARVHAIGSVRFWFDAWHDLEQLGGGSEQGVLNFGIEAPKWEITIGPDARPAVLWLESLGVDAVFVSDKQSEEVYHDFPNPAKFEGVLPVVYDDGHGNKIYSVPRRYPAHARVVETQRIDAAQVPRFGADVERLRAYVDLVERGPDSPVTLARDSPGSIRLHAALAPGQSILLQESYDPSWQAWSGGRKLAVHPDALGLMVIDAPSGVQDVSLIFTTPFENQVGRVVTIFSILVVAGLMAIGARAARNQSL